MEIEHYKTLYMYLGLNINYTGRGCGFRTRLKFLNSVIEPIIYMVVKCGVH